MVMKKFLLALLTAVFAVAMPASVWAEPAAATETAESDGEHDKINPKEIIFEHLGDGYGWEVPFDHHKRIPLDRKSVV